MSQQIKSITFEGELEVWGIYNHNRSGKKYGHDNHIYAKTFKIKDGDVEKETDYTSSRCLRHEIFKDLQPRQPSDKTFSEQFIKMAASEIGLLRGYLSPDDGLKRCSPLHIADAQTIDIVDIVFDQGSSSKPKEGDKKNKEGKDKSDTSMFSKDNAPYRRQKLFGGINLKELQFLSLYDVDNNFSMIAERDKDSFLKLLQEYFKRHSVNHDLEVKQYIDIGSIYENKRSGVLLSQEQIRHLVKIVFQRIQMINGLKAGARISYKKDSLKISFFNGKSLLDEEESNLKENLNSMNFYHFFKAV